MTKELYEELRWAIWQNTEQSVPQRLASCSILKTIYEKLNQTTTQATSTPDATTNRTVDSGVVTLNPVRWNQPLKGSF
jgi:hypothetical protein